MRTFAVAVAVALIAAPAATAKTTKNFTFKSSGAAAVPMNSSEDFPFTIAKGDQDGQISVEVHWANPFDDFDLYVYKKNSKGGLDQVGSSANGPPSTSEQTTIDSQGGPIAAGQYVVRVSNYLATSPDFSGVVKFTPYRRANVKPVARLKAVKTVRSPSKSVLDASGSRDPDGKIVNYSWDLNGDGSMETNGGRKPVLIHRFSPGVHYVTVRVTDNGGKRAYATRTVRVRR